MASRRLSQPTCIRAAFSAAGFRKWQRLVRHCLQVNSKRSLMDFAEGIWREFLDPYDGDSEDTPGHSSHRTFCTQHAYHLLGDRNRNMPSYRGKFKVPQDISVEEDSLLPKAPDLTVKVSGEAPAAPKVNDVDMPESELKALSPQISGWATRLSPSPEDLRMTRADGPLIPVETPEMGRNLLNRARVTWSPPRHGSERDKGPRLSLSKRKLELLLVQPEKTKTKK
uniref:RIKEN cDNA 1700001K19 gene n=1 Tax=Nannospalax galili TaxID=1026970 RepID=A0A8C6WAC8_NANGA